MKGLFITAILIAAQPQPKINDVGIADDLDIHVKVLAEKHHGDVKTVTSKTIDWLYNEKGFTETLSEKEITLLKDVVQIRCGIEEVKNMKARPPVKSPQPVVGPIGPTKGWYDNVRLTVTHPNGVTIPYTAKLYGYVDPTNPGNFVYDINEQTQEIQTLVNSLPASYYIPKAGTTYCVGGNCPR